MKTALIGVLVGAAIGCGGGAPPGSSTEPLDSSRVSQRHVEGHKAGAGEPAQMGDEGAMPPEIKQFHSTLAPRWHAEHTPQRMADTCGAIGQFHADATAIVDAAPPKAADPTAWASGGKQLDAAVAGLDAACRAKDAAGFEPAFERVHTSFHHVMEAGGTGEAHEPMHEHDASAPDK